MSEISSEESREDLAFPVATIPNLSPQVKPADNPTVIKKIIQGAIKAAYGLKTPMEPGSYHPDFGKKQHPLVTEDQVELVTHLVLSLQPADAIECTLATQYAISYVQGVRHADHRAVMTELFSFSHQVLETLLKFRTKGAQQISVNYNHNNPQQINTNIQVVQEKPVETIEVCEDERA
jgi:hypothetical protein